MQGENPLRPTIDKRHGRGLCPARAHKGFPQSSSTALEGEDPRASLRADLRSASPFPFRLQLHFKGGRYPSPCTCYPSLAWARAKACL
jgi:hypothetical protein